MNIADQKVRFNSGQKLLRQVGTDLVPVTFIMSGPRVAHSIGSLPVAEPPNIAIVVMHGTLAAVPVNELKADE
jgi:hypothetical protein